RRPASASHLRTPVLLPVRAPAQAASRDHGARVRRARPRSRPALAVGSARDPPAHSPHRRGASAIDTRTPPHGPSTAVDRGADDTVGVLRRRLSRLCPGRLGRVIVGNATVVIAASNPSDVHHAEATAIVLEHGPDGIVLHFLTLAAVLVRPARAGAHARA